MAHITYIVTDPITVKIYLIPQFKVLTQQHWKVSLICGGDKASLPAPEALPGVSIHHVTMRREISPFSDFFAIVKMLFLLIGLRPAIVIAGTPKAGLLGMIASRLACIPRRIYQLHGLRLETATAWQRRVLLLTETLACWCSHEVLCVSKSLQNKVAALGICKSQKITVLGAGSCTGIHIAAYAPTPERLANASALKNTLRIPPDAYVIGFIGRLTKDKGVVDLWNAFTIVRQEQPSACLLLIGTFEDGDPIPGDIRLKIMKSEYIRHIEWTDDPKPYLHLMDVLVLPTYREGLPGVLLEAAATATPIVATDATGVIDVVMDGHTGLLCPVGDAHAIARNILRVLLNRTLSLNLSRNAMRKVQTEFSRDQVLQQLASFCEDSLYRSRTYRRMEDVSLQRDRDSVPAVNAQP